MNLSEMQSTISNELAEQRDKFLIDFFGSMDQARKLAHLYVLEVYPGELQIPTTHDIVSQKYVITQQVRIRPKTHDELVAEASAL